MMLWQCHQKILYETLLFLSLFHYMLGRGSVKVLKNMKLVRSAVVKMVMVRKREVVWDWGNRNRNRAQRMLYRRVTVKKNQISN